MSIYPEMISMLRSIQHMSIPREVYGLKIILFLIRLGYVHQWRLKRDYSSVKCERWIKLGSKNSVRSPTYLGQVISRSSAFGVFEVPKICCGFLDLCLFNSILWCFTKSLWVCGLHIPAWVCKLSIFPGQSRPLDEEKLAFSWIIVSIHRCKMYSQHLKSFSTSCRRTSCVVNFCLKI